MPDDGVRAAALHGDCFPHGWSAGDFRRLAGGPPYIALAAWLDGKLAGILVASFVGEEGEILTFAVAPAFRRLGIASTLLKRLIEDAAQIGVKTIFLEVGRSNRAALALYERCGFTIAGMRKGYYAAPSGLHEDALLMKRLCS
ncbi:MAG: ribosomal protein S18-alanine N-acetyltransferase [Rhodomicrobium sp.]|nr:ribosomal protein S18-alanine N-acetyltransferase [Rhodomicrobium sp.]